MKKKKREQIEKYQWWSPNKALLGFLLFSMALAVTIVACNKDSSTPTEETEIPPDWGGGESTSLTTTLFTSMAKDAAGDIVGAGMGWAMSALGLADGSPDYTAQLAKIDADLQVIIQQLAEIEAELSEIEAELTIINCSEWASTLSTQKGRIDDLMSNYKTLTATATTGGNVTQAQIADWVDQVLAQGSYTSHTPMGEILAELADQLYVPPSSGVIPACVATITQPANGTYGTDTIYYNTVKLYIDYYYSYQVQGLALLNEALHHKAWVAAGSPVSDTLSADSISYICQDANAMLYCNESAANVNNLYNALIKQLTSGGAPYTQKDLVMRYDKDNPALMPYSLEDFTTAIGDNCADPLTSAHPCGATASLYNKNYFFHSTYKGYQYWWNCAPNDLSALTSGWTSGTVGDYLENKRGFKNMKNKVILSNGTVSIELSSANIHQNYISFIDTDIDKSLGINQPTNSTNDYNKLAHKSGENHVNNNHCGYYYNYTEGSGLPSSRNNFYTCSGVSWWTDVYGTPRMCENLKWNTEPGWLASNASSTGYGTNQYHWPRRLLNAGDYSLTCTEGRSLLNAGGVWTMCGDDYTAWFDYYVPRPETCDNAGAGVSCNLSATTINNAKRIFSQFDNNTVNNPL